jgi:predicted dehydrogenase
MKFATIGTSWITEAFITAARETNVFEPAAVYSRSEEKAKEFAARNGIALYFDDLEKIAQHEEIEAVYIASPNSMHFKHAKIFLENGKHVICEKPMFSNVKELDEAFKIAEQNGVFLMEAIRNVHSPNFKILQDNLEKIGKIRSALLHYLQYSSRYDAFLHGEVANIFSPKFSGGALVDLGVYPISVAVALFGEPKEIHYTPVMLSSGVDGSGTLIMQYDEFVCTVLCSKISQSHIPSEIHGEKGTLVVDHVAPINSIQFVENKTRQSVEVAEEQSKNDMKYEIEEFVRMVKEKDYKAYEEYKKWSRAVLMITEKARRQNGILFDVEK